jgi:uncharacterized membrane protein YphA (DoxX/SURF4 family)
MSQVSLDLPGGGAALARRILEGPVIQVLARLALAAVFLWAAIPKIGDPAVFARDIANYRLLPGALVHPLAVTLPWIEIVAATLLVLGLWTRAAALVCTGLLFVFSVALAAAVARGLDIECGCFGKAEGSRVGWADVARDALFLIPGVVLVAFDRGRYGLGAVLRRGG